MELIYPIASPETISDKILAFQGDLESVFCKLSDIGYTGVELMIRDASKIDIQMLLSLLAKYRFKVPAIGTGQIFNDGLSLTSNDNKIVNTTIIRCIDAVKLAAQLNSKVIIGKVRGSYENGIDRKKTEAIVRNSFNIILEEAIQSNVKIVLEPQSRLGTNFLNTIDECIEWVRSFNYSNFKIMADTFHMNIEDPSIYASLIKAKPYLEHIHLSDSNRLAPGLGNINFNEILKVLNALNYKEYLSVEVIQKPNSETVAFNSYEYISNILRLVNS